MRDITLLIKEQRQRQITLRHWDLIWPTKRQIQNFLRQPQRETWEPCNRKNNFEPNLIPKRPNWTNPNKSVQQGLQCLNHGRTVCVCVCVYTVLTGSSTIVYLPLFRAALYFTCCCFANMLPAIIELRHCHSCEAVIAEKAQTERYNLRLCFRFTDLVPH